MIIASIARIAASINLILCPLEKSPGNKLNSPLVPSQPILVPILCSVIHRYFLDNTIHVVKPTMLDIGNRVSRGDQQSTDSLVTLRYFVDVGLVLLADFIDLLFCLEVAL